jgi:hypothetical protein
LREQAVEKCGAYFGEKDAMRKGHYFRTFLPPSFEELRFDKISAGRYSPIALQET